MRVRTFEARVAWRAVPSTCDRKADLAANIGRTAMSSMKIRQVEEGELAVVRRPERLQLRSGLIERRADP